MAAKSTLEIHQLIMTIRFIQGYRYLDRCGETLIRLEEVLEKDWIPAELSPISGTVKNDQLGMVATFNSSNLTIQQVEFLSFEHFRDQACKIYDTLWRTLEIERIIAPVMRIILQRGFQAEEEDAAQQYLRELKLCTPNPQLVSLLGGDPRAIDFTLVTERDVIWNNLPVHRIRRVKASVIRQQRERSIDQRLLQRTSLLPGKQREALMALQQLRKQHPDVSPLAAHIDLEDVLETEFVAKEFDLPSFLEEVWQWADKVKNDLPRLQRRKHDG